MVAFSTLPLIGILLLINSYTFLINKNKSNCFNNLGLKHKILVGIAVQHDEPFILTQSLEPGKQNELVINERETHGINKIIKDIERRNSRNDPIFPVGSIVFVKKGKFRCSRGTVLFNKPTEIAKPYEVLLALDCRNYEGIVKEDLSMDHGTSLWFSEKDLSEDEIYFKKTPPLLSSDYVPITKHRYIKTSRIYNNTLINCLKYNEIVSTYKEAVRNKKTDHFTPVIAYSQLARSLNIFSTECQDKIIKGTHEKYVSFKKVLNEKVDKKFIEQLVDDVLQSVRNSELTMVNYSWILWATTKFDYYDIFSHKFLTLVKEVHRSMTLEGLRALDSTCLCNVLFSYTRFNPESIDHIYNISKILTSIPMENAKTLPLNLMLSVFYIKNLDPGNLLEYLTQYILKYHYKIPKSEAIYFIRSLQDYKTVPPQVMDKLYAIAFSHEDEKSRVFSSSDFYNLLLCSIRDKEMFTLFEKEVYLSDTMLEPYAMLKSLHVLSRTNYNKMTTWILDKAISSIEYFSDLEKNRFFTSTCRVANVPKQLINTLYKYFKTYMFQKPDLITFQIFLRFINKHNLGTRDDILGILETLSTNKFNWNLNNANRFLLNLHIQSQKHDINAHEHYPEFIEEVVSYVAPDKKYHINEYAHLIYCISEVAPKLFDKAAEIALRYRVNRKMTGEAVSKGVLNLAQALYNIGLRFSKDFNDYSCMKVISFNNSGKPCTGKPVSTACYEFHNSPRCSQWSTMFLYLLVRGGFITVVNFPKRRLIEFLAPVKKYLSNFDLRILRMSMDYLGVEDHELDDLIRSVPKGIKELTRQESVPSSPNL
nr:hypothetical protein MACL_00001385 [Theileria orientalis]